MGYNASDKSYENPMKQVHRSDKKKRYEALLLIVVLENTRALLSKAYTKLQVLNLSQPLGHEYALSHSGVQYKQKMECESKDLGGNLII